MKTERHADFLILGGGPTGLGAARRLMAEGKDFHILEAEPRFGGLSASFADEQGFTWDLGGHVLFSHYDRFDRAMDAALGKDGWFTHERESWVWICNHWVPYPFQNNLHRLPPAERWQCVRGLLEATQKAKTGGAAPAHFREWIQRTFGTGIADLFMIPYNFKVWAFPPEQLDYHWIGERVSVPGLEAVLRAVCTGQDEVSWGPNATFRFPKHGGTGAIWAALGGSLPADSVSLSTRVTGIDPAARLVRTGNGATWHYQPLISTIPLNHLIRLCPGVVPEAEADRLSFSATNLIGIGLDGQAPADLQTKCWMYFPESNSPYYRVTVFSNYSANNVPRPGEQWSLMAEISESAGKPEDLSKIRESTVRALGEDGLSPDPDAICSLVHTRLPQGYPTPFLGRDRIVDPILRRFEHAGIFSRGRFGAWKYEVGNQDHCFAQGDECANRLLQGGDDSFEPTVFTPHAVNARKNP
jgi:protoporphyrinogen oxidase